MKRISIITSTLLLVFSLTHTFVYASSETKEKSINPDYTIDILIPKESELLHTLQEEITKQNENINAHVSLVTKIKSKAANTKNILVAVNSTMNTISEVSLHYDAVIVFYISPKEYRELLSDFYESNPSLPITAIYSTPPISRQLQLIKQIVPQKKSIGILFHPENKKFASQVKEKAKALQLNSVMQETANPKSLPKDVALLLRNSDVLFAHKELGPYHSESIRTILLSAYRQRKPVFGLSAAYTKAGVLATTHSNTKQISLALSKHIQHFSRTGSLLPPGYIELFNIYTNEQVANSLGIIIQDKDAIKQNILRIENSQ